MLLLDHNLRLDRFTEAADACSGRRSANWKSRNFWSPVTISRFLRATRREWNAKSRALRGEHAEDWMSHNQALVLARSGRMRQARTMWQRAIALAQQAGKRETAAIYEAAEAVCEAHFGNAAAAKERARAALELQKAAMWSMPRRSRWRCPATLPDRKGSPRIWQNDSRRTPRAIRVSSHAARAFRALP